MIDFTVIIPARFGASRLPGKPLLLLGGRPVIEHVWEAAIQSGAQRVIIATDHAQIAECAHALGAEVCMTAETHRSGTDRIAEVVGKEELADSEIIVNLQGDEPLMPPVLLAQVARVLGQSPKAAVATLATPLADIDELHDPHIVKLVANHLGQALYFSRAPIPWDREGRGDVQLATAQRHLGLYAYRAGFLRRYSSLPASQLESLEQLEQLRILDAGEVIQVARAETSAGPGIDTAADLMVAEATLAARQRGTS